MLTYLLFLPLLCLNCQTQPEKENVEINTFKPAKEVGLIQDSLLAEASGIVESKANPDMLWIINDSGNEPKLFLINKNGKTIHSYWLDGIDNNDWEDLAIYTDKSTGKSKIYIGDIGDNFAIRDHINVIVFDEPKFDDPGDTLINEFHNYLFRYEDGVRDAETIMINPDNSNLYIISKREENVRIYEAPTVLTADTMELTYKLSLPVNNVTSGDISPDGDEILIKTYSSILYWKKEDGESIIDPLSRAYESIAYILEPQGESICWAIDGKGFFTLSEKSWSDKQILYYYERNTP